MLYDELGLRPVINGLGPVTRLGGLPMSDTVFEAMRAAVATNVRMDELQEAAGIELARHLGTPAAHVTSGAYAALVLAAAVCAAGGDSRGVDELPLTGTRSRVIVQSVHRDPYDHAITSVGLRLTEVGYPYSTRRHELARELDDTVAAVLHRLGGNGDVLPLRVVAELAHAAEVPVIVDAADRVPSHRAGRPAARRRCRPDRDLRRQGLPRPAGVGRSLRTGRPGAPCRPPSPRHGPAGRDVERLGDHRLLADGWP